MSLIQSYETVLKQNGQSPASDTLVYRDLMREFEKWDSAAESAAKDKNLLAEPYFLTTSQSRSTKPCTMRERVKSPSEFKLGDTFGTVLEPFI